MEIMPAYAFKVHTDSNQEFEVKYSIQDGYTLIIDNSHSLSISKEDMMKIVDIIIDLPNYTK